jgi:hypothetical protein
MNKIGCALFRGDRRVQIRRLAGALGPHRARAQQSNYYKCNPEVGRSHVSPHPDQNDLAVDSMNEHA